MPRGQYRKYRTEEFNHMISDALSEFVHCIDDHLNDPDFDRIYEGEPRDRIIRLRNEAEYIRLLLDAPPRCPLPPEAVLSERIEAQRTRNVEDRCYVLASEAEALGWPKPWKTQQGAANAASPVARSGL
jgi:hypothetical protein